MALKQPNSYFYFIISFLLGYTAFFLPFFELSVQETYKTDPAVYEFFGLAPPEEPLPLGQEIKATLPYLGGPRIIANYCMIPILPDATSEILQKKKIWESVGTKFFFIQILLWLLYIVKEKESIWKIFWGGVLFGILGISFLLVTGPITSCPFVAGVLVRDIKIIWQTALVLGLSIGFSIIAIFLSYKSPKHLEK